MTNMIFHDFPVLEFSRKKIQDFPGGVGTLLLIIYYALLCHEPVSFSFSILSYSSRRRSSCSCKTRSTTIWTWRSENIGVSRHCEADVGDNVGKAVVDSDGDGTSECMLVDACGELVPLSDEHMPMRPRRWRRFISIPILLASSSAHHVSIISELLSCLQSVQSASATLHFEFNVCDRISLKRQAWATYGCRTKSVSADLGSGPG